jgi:hypothetical protein
MPPDERRAYEPQDGWEDIAKAQIDAAAAARRPSTSAAQEIADRVEGKVPPAEPPANDLESISAERLQDLLLDAAEIIERRRRQLTPGGADSGPGLEEEK